MTDDEIKTLAMQIYRHNFDAVDALEALARTSPSEAVSVAVYILRNERFSDDMDSAYFAIKTINMAIGASAGLELLLGHWGVLAERRRLAIGCLTASQNLLSNEACRFLFEHHANTARDKHVIAVNLAAYAQWRNAKSMILSMLHEAPYIDQYHQEVLHKSIKFVESWPDSE
jgi:nanoRNase/pAp phosphatase (c-di-AMP/oligoRNAs hydrolase)